MTVYGLHRPNSPCKGFTVLMPDVKGPAALNTIFALGLHWYGLPHLHFSSFGYKNIIIEMDVKNNEMAHKRLLFPKIR